MSEEEMKIYLVEYAHYVRGAQYELDFENATELIPASSEENALITFKESKGKNFESLQDIEVSEVKLPGYEIKLEKILDEETREAMLKEKILEEMEKIKQDPYRNMDQREEHDRIMKQRYEDPKFDKLKEKIRKEGKKKEQAKVIEMIDLTDVLDIGYNLAQSVDLSYLVDTGKDFVLSAPDYLVNAVNATGSDSTNGEIRERDSPRTMCCTVGAGIVVVVGGLFVHYLLAREHEKGSVIDKKK